MNSWLQLQTQRLREQGVRQRTRAATKKILASLIGPWIDQLHALPRVRNAALYMLRVTGLTARVKALLSTEPTPQVVHLSPRALQIRQELQRILDRLEKTS
jgi:hypothetical protein